MEKKIKSINPGEELVEEFFEPKGFSQNRLSLDLGVHPRQIN